MKSFTDIEQSKKLTEILPIESADMVYIWHSTSDNPAFRFDDDMPPMVLKDIPIEDITTDTLPCWSLAALLDIMPDRIDDSHFLTLDKEGKEYCCCYEDINGNSFKHEFADNAIDACYKMIIKLHELNLL